MTCETVILVNARAAFSGGDALCALRSATLEAPPKFGAK